MESAVICSRGIGTLALRGYPLRIRPTWSPIGLADRIRRRIADHPVPAGRLDRERRHAGAARLLGLGLGDRDRQDVPVFPHQARHGPLRTGAWSGQSIEELYRALSAKPTQSMAACFVAAMWNGNARSKARHDPLPATSDADREGRERLHRPRNRAWLERRLLVLATVGSPPAFVGLFGTVWGIMSSFQSIAASKNTSLAVVAPGIAEALFATAIGLIACGPATISYNQFTSEVNRQGQRLEGFADEFSAIPLAQSTNGHDPERSKPAFGSDHAPGQAARGAVYCERSMSTRSWR